MWLTEAIAADTALPLTRDLFAIVGVAAFVAFVAARFKVMPLIGFLLGGAIAGPAGLGIVQDRELVDSAAELGVILLLFVVGLELNLSRLLAMKKLIFIGGGFQVTLAVAVTTAADLILAVPWQDAMFTGMLISLSSTAIVLAWLKSEGATGSELGQACVALLIFQDLAVVTMVLVIPAIGDGGADPGQIGLVVLKAVLMLVAVVTLARRVMPRVIEAIAKTCSPEMFVLGVLAICFGTAYLTSLAGISLALGAFLAGLMVGESKYSHHALAEVAPVQTLFSAAFFVSIGMLIDVSTLVEAWPVVLGTLLVVCLLKVLMTYVSMRIVGMAKGISFATAIILFQVGEFSFVLELVGRDAGLSPFGLGDLGTQGFVAAAVLTMAATPFLAAWARRFDHSDDADTELAHSDLVRDDHVIIAGYGDVAQRLMTELNRREVPTLVVTLNPEGARKAEAAAEVMRGDSARAGILELAGISRAKVMIIADSNANEALRTIDTAHRQSPGVRIFVAAQTEAELVDLGDAPIDLVVLPTEDGLERMIARITALYEDEPIRAVGGYAV